MNVREANVYFRFSSSNKNTGALYANGKTSLKEDKKPYRNTDTSDIPFCTVAGGYTGRGYPDVALAGSHYIIYVGK
jgi:hypothetical protein